VSEWAAWIALVLSTLTFSFLLGAVIVAVRLGRRMRPYLSMLGGMTPPSTTTNSGAAAALVVEELEFRDIDGETIP
jgi:hypothetical protein